MANPVLLESISIIVGIFILILAVEGLRRLFSLDREFSRKAVHFLIAAPILLLPLFGFHKETLIAVPAVFIPVLFAAILSGRLQAIHSQRRSFGTVYYALSFLLLVWLFYPAAPFFLILPMLILCIGDSLAAFPGEKIKAVHFYCPAGDRKTVEGSLVMGLVSSGLTLLLLWPDIQRIILPDGVRFPPVSSGEAIILAVLTGILASLAEAISRKGSDNLSIPLTAATFLFLALNRGPVPAGRLFLSGILSILSAVFSVRMRLLNAAGAMAMVVLGVFLFGLGGVFWTVPLLVFFGSAGVLSAVNRRRKSVLVWETEKGSTRDALQVLANGGIPLLMFVLFRISGNQVFIVGFLASAASAAGDTWATEVGVFSRRRPIGLLTGKTVERGMSGGVSLLGSAAALAGSSLTAGSGWFLLKDAAGFPTNLLLLVIAGIGGFVGAFIDSLFGASLQGIYRCRVCGKLTEQSSHCDADDNPVVSGVRWMNNDMVNFLSFALAGLLAMGAGFLVLSE